MILCSAEGHKVLAKEGHNAADRASDRSRQRFTERPNTGEGAMQSIFSDICVQSNQTRDPKISKTKVASSTASKLHT